MYGWSAVNGLVHHACERKLIKVIRHENEAEKLRYFQIGKINVLDSTRNGIAMKKTVDDKPTFTSKVTAIIDRGSTI